MDNRCFLCLLSRVRFECSLVLSDDADVEDIVNRCRQVLEEARTREIPAPRIATEVHRTAYRLAGSVDPYLSLKQQNNEVARLVCRTVRPMLHTFRDRVLASIIGNTMDYAVEDHSVPDDFFYFFLAEFQKGLTIDDTEAILQRTKRVVYFTDNCGEIVFDCLVIQDLMQRGASVTLAVKGEPILNDATLAEARMLGLDRVVDIITTTGSGDVGISLEKIPPELSLALEDATLIISKGMANYESLNEEERCLPPIAYLMAVKCDPIARSIGVPRGSSIALLSRN